MSDDDLVLIDGTHGEIVVHPTAQDLARYRQHQREQTRSTEALSRLKHARTMTADGMEIHLYANAEMSADIVQARAPRRRRHRSVPHRIPVPAAARSAGRGRTVHAYRDVVLGMGGCR
jgi:phosphotransferase system enzyme I (PtsI)